MPNPTWSVQIAFAGSVSGLFRIGVSKLGGTDVLGANSALTSNSFTDVTADAKKFDIQRGKSGDLTLMLSSTCTLVLTDKNGKYNPTNVASPYYGTLLPMRPVRIKATHPNTGLSYYIFYGFISDIACNPLKNAYETTINCVDLFEWLNNFSPTISSLGQTTVGNAITQILIASGWSDVTMRSIDAGRYVPDFSADGTKTALSLINSLIDRDRGLFFVTGSGVARYISGASLWSSKSPLYTYDQSVIKDIRPGSQVRRVLNWQNVTRTGGVKQTAKNAISQQSYAWRQGSAISNAFFNTDGEALSLGTFLVGAYGKPIPPATQVSMDSSASDVQLTQMLSQELGDLVAASETTFGTSVVGFVAGIQHHADTVSKYLESTMTIEQKPVSLFTIGVSKIGGADVIGF